MLRKFSVSNYKNFNRTITLDFTKKRDYTFNENCIQNGLLNKVIIYGENASGKSNLGFAVFDIVSVLTDKNVSRKQMDEVSFLNADSREPEASFYYEFIFGETLVSYSYRKESPSLINAEKLCVNGAVVFDYNIEEGMTEERLEMICADSLNFDYYEDDMAFLRYVANNTSQPSGSVLKKLMDFVNHMLWFRRLNDTNYIGFSRGSEKLSDYICKQGYLRDFEDFLFRMAGIKYHLEEDFDEVNNRRRIVEVHGKRKLDFAACASSGTSALYLFYYWAKHLDEVSFLWIDEFDAFYHFELARNIVTYLRDSNKVQTVFTSHNTALLSNEILRPDCYFRLENGDLKSFPDATFRELREGHNLEKLYRNGEFNGEE